MKYWYCIILAHWRTIPCDSSNALPFGTDTSTGGNRWRTFSSPIEPTTDRDFSEPKKNSNKKHSSIHFNSIQANPSQSKPIQSQFHFK